MDWSVTALKRLGRIGLSPLSFRTKVALWKAEFRNAHDLVVPIGDCAVHLTADTNRIDYFTLYGSVVDRHFDVDVRDAVVLDIGAHKGYYAARSLGDGARRVDSFEPASQNLAALTSSAGQDGRWHVHPVAVGPEAGTVTLNLSAGSWGHSVHTPMGGEVIGTEDVKMVALTELLAQASTDGAPVVVKINVEGAAGAMIMATEPKDWHSVTSLWVDLEPNDPVAAPALLAHLNTCGLRHVANENNRHHFLPKTVVAS